MNKHNDCNGYTTFKATLSNNETQESSDLKGNKLNTKYLRIGLPIIFLLLVACLWWLVFMNNSNSPSGKKGIEDSNQSNNIILPGESASESVLTPTPSQSPEKNSESPSSSSPQIAVNEKTTPRRTHTATSILPSSSPLSSPLSSPSLTYKNTEIVVRIFEHFNYGGWQADFTVGNYTTADIIAHGGLDNQTSSIRITPGYRVKLFHNDKFSLLGVELKNDATMLMYFNDRLSSMSIEYIGE